MNNFGKVFQEEFGFRKENVVVAAKEQLWRAT